MTRINYERRSGALRKLLRQLKPVTGGTIIEYCFGALYDTSTGLWHIYNYNTNNCIATVKFYKKTVTIRYRRNSHYSHVLRSFNYPASTLHVESENLSQKSRWLKDLLRPMIMSNLRAIHRAERSRDVVVETEAISETTRVPRTYRDRNGRLRYIRNGRFAPEPVVRFAPRVADSRFFIEPQQYLRSNVVVVSPDMYQTLHRSPFGTSGIAQIPTQDVLAEIEAERQSAIREMESDVPF